MIYSDVTERKKAEARLRAGYHSLLEVVVEHAILFVTTKRTFHRVFRGYNL